LIDGKSFNEWKQKEGKGAFASAILGISVFVAFISALTLIVMSIPKADASGYSDMFKGGSWNNGVYAYIGVDYTKGVSPQCVEGSADDRATSNMGFGVQAWRSQNRQHELNAQITHHSCVLGKDRNGYDGIGIEYKFWIYRK
jgi:hypothetical protein